MKVNTVMLVNKSDCLFFPKRLDEDNFKMIQEILTDKLITRLNLNYDVLLPTKIQIPETDQVLILL